jgi:hypothetical protein
MLDLFPMQRSPGHHVSGALKRILQQTQPERFGSDEPPSQTRLNLGNAMERAIIAALTDRYPGYFVSPGELWHDGHSGTPDLWYLGTLGGDDDEAEVIEEFGTERATVEIKLTWASSRRADDIEDIWFWHYWQQLRAYAHMSGIKRGILIIVFLVGNWRDESNPVAMMWEDVWSEEELRETWDMVKLYPSPEQGHRGTRGNASRSSGGRKHVSPESQSRIRNGKKLSVGMRSSTSVGRRRERSGRS